MRWVRPENIRLIAPWDAVGTPGTVLTSAAPRGGGRPLPDTRYAPKPGELAPREQWGKLLNGPPRVYVVAPNDGLKKIARTVYGDPARWREILEANRGQIDPRTNTIYPGQKLLVPPDGKAKPAAPTPPVAPRTPIDPKLPVA